MNRAMFVIGVVTASVALIINEAIKYLPVV